MTEILGHSLFLQSVLAKLRQTDRQTDRDKDRDTETVTVTQREKEREKTETENRARARALISPGCLQN